ncbi:response regulator [Piscinibacter gummiphilus]|uniref:histidine kinase n=1 Tax=Piscinibacter gummiphilus TaxID=946333 RepID=A0ABZ0CLY3_9BURK|nr:response regulator [Piscinibacter gummiphilus]WOB05992.1 response regulator [Piscinibacter gummiphilus]
MTLDTHRSALPHPIDRTAHELLVVNDDPASRYATVRTLQNAGFRTREASTGLTGLEAIDESISVVVLDVHLPDIDGYELVRRLRTRADTARLPVLHLTAAFTSDQDKVRGLDSGADAYLTHPVEPAVLVATVQALVRTRAAEEAMRRGERRFRAIYDQAPGGICLLGEDYRVRDANAKMLDLLGRGSAEVIGQELVAFVPSPWDNNLRAWLGAPQAGHGKAEFPVRTPAGVEVQLAWVLSRDVEPGLHIAVATDVSERNQLVHQRQQLLDSERMARTAAERMSRMKDELIAVLSHELRTPLNAIMGWTHVLQKRGGDATYTRGMAAIERNVRIQARLISDILDTSRLNMGKLMLSFEMIDPAALLTEALAAMQDTAAEAGVSLRVSLQPRHRPIRADGSRLQQVIWNLVSNAIKFSPPGTEVRVELRDEADALHLSVIDQGRGISSAFLPYLFDRFTQSDAGSNRKRGGLGLGLSIVKQLVEAHGGVITVQSDGENQGARFDIVLPYDTGLQGSSDPVTAFDEALADEAEGGLNGVRVLVVDDDADASAMLNIILADRGALVEMASSHDDALGVLERRAPDVMVSDIGMPGKDGYDLIREVRRRETSSGRRLPSIALTSFTRDQDKQHVLEAGFDLHCAKPLQPLQLVQAVATLARRGASRASS